MIINLKVLTSQNQPTAQGKLPTRQLISLDNLAKLALGLTRGLFKGYITVWMLPMIP
jgi:hypothetical protein